MSIITLPQAIQTQLDWYNDNIIDIQKKNGELEAVKKEIDTYNATLTGDLSSRIFELTEKQAAFQQRLIPFLGWLIEATCHQVEMTTLLSNVASLLRLKQKVTLFNSTASTSIVSINKLHKLAVVLFTNRAFTELLEKLEPQHLVSGVNPRKMLERAKVVLTTNLDVVKTTLYNTIAHSIGRLASSSDGITPNSLAGLQNRFARYTSVCEIDGIVVDDLTTDNSLETLEAILQNWSGAGDKSVITFPRPSLTRVGDTQIFEIEEPLVSTIQDHIHWYGMNVQVVSEVVTDITNFKSVIDQFNTTLKECSHDEQVNNLAESRVKLDQFRTTITRYIDSIKGFYEVKNKMAECRDGADLLCRFVIDMQQFKEDWADELKVYDIWQSEIFYITNCDARIRTLKEAILPSELLVDGLSLLTQLRGCHNLLEGQLDSSLSELQYIFDHSIGRLQDTVYLLDSKCDPNGPWGEWMRAIRYIPRFKNVQKVIDSLLRTTDKIGSLMTIRAIYVAALAV